MRPVSSEHRISQAFGSGATAGIAPNPDKNSGWAYYVHLYGNYQPHGHAGLDIACPVGTPIVAPADGTVIYAGWSEDLPGTGPIRKWLFYYNFGGILTLIQHNGWISAIAHQSTNEAVHVGMRVKEGQVIGKSGNTKTRTTKVAPHVHVEALVDLTYKTGGGLIYGRANPEPFFGAAAIAPQGSITPQSNESTTESEEDFMAGTIDAQQAEDIAQRAAQLVVAALNGKVLINPQQAEDIVQATTARTADAVDARNTGKQIDRQQADDIARAAARYAEETK